MNEFDFPHLKFKMPIPVGKRYRLNLNAPLIGLNDKALKLTGKTYSTFYINCKKHQMLQPQIISELEINGNRRVPTAKK